MRKISLFTFVVVVSMATMTNVCTMQAQSNNVPSDVWEVEIVKKSTNEVVVNQVVAINSFSFEGLEENTEYFARVRTKNLFFSGWTTSDVFTYNSTTGFIQNNFYEELIIRSEKGRLIILSTTPQCVKIYNINGCLIRSLAIENGEAIIDGLEKGIYLVNNRKVIVK